MKGHYFRLPLTLAAVVAITACADPASRSAAPLAPESALASAAENTALAELRRATAAYHDVARALADGFVPVITECEGEGGVGIPYANIPRLLDAVIDPSQPEALLYEPADNGDLKLVGVELVIPYPFWSSATPPSFLGHAFQREDDLGVWALHVWVWRQNPDGMFAEHNPRVACES
jgi:hypothetical protein